MPRFWKQTQYIRFAPSAKFVTAGPVPSQIGKAVHRTVIDVLLGWEVTVTHRSALLVFGDEAE
jgi:hypothetical protein